MSNSLLMLPKTKNVTFTCDCFSSSFMEEVHDVLGDKQHVAFDDLAKLHQLGLVTRLSV